MNLNYLLLNEVDIILMPEMFNTAFCPMDNYLAESMRGDTIKWMLKIAKQKKSAISGTLMIKEEDKVFNRLVWISKKGMVFTCEPGIYILEEEFGIRLENDILVTVNGPNDLMKNMPIEIEDLMNS